MAGRNYGTDPYGIISRGDPSARGGSSVSVGRVGNSVRDYSSPGRSFGSGVGATLSLPMKTKSKAKGGEIKKSGCSVKAYGDMIKKAAGGKVQTSSDTARKLATEMGGMKKGGKPKNGLAVMIAIGQPMKKPVKKAKGGAAKVRKYAEGGVDVGENPERLARNAARKADARAAILAKKAEQKRILAEGRPQIEAARAARETAAERNAAQYGGLSQAAISSALNKAMYAQGASGEARRAAMQNLTTGAQKAPRDIRGKTDIGSIMQIVSQYATPDQLNAALKASGRPGMFNPIDTYNTGVSGATKGLNELIAARDARAGIGIKKPVTPMTPPVDYAAGGAGKTRKGQAPVKKAKGGAGKVRKGMMSPSGDILQAVKPKKGM